MNAYFLLNKWQKNNKFADDEKTDNSAMDKQACNE